jgi:hypothetical protein
MPDFWYEQFVAREHRVPTEEEHFVERHGRKPTEWDVHPGPIHPDSKLTSPTLHYAREIDAGWSVLRGGGIPSLVERVELTDTQIVVFFAERDAAGRPITDAWGLGDSDRVHALLPE